MCTSKRGLQDLRLVGSEESGHQWLLGCFGLSALPVGFVSLLFGKGIKQQIVLSLLNVLGGHWGDLVGGKPCCDCSCVLEVMFFGSFDACLCARQSDGHPVLKAIDRGVFKQCVQRWSEKSIVFAEAFGFEGKHPCHLSLKLVKFTVSLGFCRDSMQVFIALGPKLNGVFHGDRDCLSSPGVCAAIVGCVGKK